jgi:hypothetical protein
MFDSIFRRRAHVEDAFTPADEIGGQGWMDTDWLFFRHLANVMFHEGISGEEVQRACAGHARALTDPNPKRAMDYRSAVLADAARQWPGEASLAFISDLDETWAPSEKSRQDWSQLPPEMRRSYVRQGRVTREAVARGFAERAGR